MDVESGAVFSGYRAGDRPRHGPAARTGAIHEKDMGPPGNKPCGGIHMVCFAYLHFSTEGCLLEDWTSSRCLESSSAKTSSSPSGSPFGVFVRFLT